jgi:hypothetical protein
MLWLEKAASIMVPMMSGETPASMSRRISCHSDVLKPLVVRSLCFGAAVDVQEGSKHHVGLGTFTLECHPPATALKQKSAGKGCVFLALIPLT